MQTEKTYQFFFYIGTSNKRLSDHCYNRQAQMVLSWSFLELTVHFILSEPNQQNQFPNFIGFVMTNISENLIISSMKLKEIAYEVNFKAFGLQKTVVLIISFACSCRGLGELTAADIRAAYTTMGIDTTLEECSWVVEEMDTTGEGIINFNDFSNSM